MDAVTSFIQCSFCSHLSTWLLSRCDMCGELLSPRNLVALEDLYNMSGEFRESPCCTRCNRRLLLNNQSCTFCNAVYQGSAVGAPLPMPPRRALPRPPPLSMVDIVVDMVTMQLGVSAERDNGGRIHALGDAARDRLLQPLPADTALTLDADAVCPVCLDGMADRSSTTALPLTQLPCCRNAFHVACLTRWFTTHNTCPTCRHNLNELAA